MHDLSRFCKKVCFGCYALDELPKKITRPCLIVSNTAVSTHPGKHWVAFYFGVNSQKAEFFDSFGRKPTQRQFKTFLKNNCKSFTYSPFKLQSDYSTCCGHWCLLFLYNRNKSISMADFVKSFDLKKRRQNDMKILRMYAKLNRQLLRNSKKYKTQIGGNCNTITCNQTCVPLRKKRRKCT